MDEKTDTVERIKTPPLFVGLRANCGAFLRLSKGHYVYILRRPDGRPFYVGKGTGDRVFHHENEARHPNDWRSNSHKLNVIRAIRRQDEVVTYEIDFVSDDEVSVYSREAELISSLRRLHEGGPLTNRAPGGGIVNKQSPFSKEKHTATLSGIPEDNVERATLNRFVLSVGQMDSAVIKPASQFVARPTARFPRSTRTPSFRQAVALVAAAAANGIIMDAACAIPRRVSVEDVNGLVENGVACDILTSGLANIQSAAKPDDEVFLLNEGQARQAVGLVGLRKCLDLGVLTVL